MKQRPILPILNCLFLLLILVIQSAHSKELQLYNNLGNIDEKTIAGPKMTISAADATSSKDQKQPLFRDQQELRPEPSHENIEFKSAYFDSQIISVSFCGDQLENLLALTANGLVYMSEDHGFNWLNVTDRMAELSENSEQIDSSIVQILQNPMDLKVILLVGSRRHFVTDNCGKTIQPLNSNLNFHQFKFHPTNRNWLLAAVWTNCSKNTDPDSCSRYKELYVSQDLGKTWQLIGEYVLQFSWGMEGISQSFVVPETRIIIAHMTNRKGHQVEGKWVEEAEIAMSDDFFKTKTVLVPGGNKFMISEHFIYAVKVINEKTEEIQLLASNAKVATYTFSPIKISTDGEKLKDHGYFLLDWGQDRVFLHINHEGADSSYGTLYISDSTGVRYTNSLKYHIRSSDVNSDFVKVEGLKEIYIANVYDEAAVKRTKKSSQTSNDDQLPIENSSAKSSGAAKLGSTASSDDSDSKSQAQTNLENHVKSLISFNRGSTWQKIAPPAKDSKGNLINCEGECSLHLTGFSTKGYSPPYSSENSLGIVLGVGNVGESLSTKEDEFNTFFSRDGGLTWYEIIQGPHIYEIGNHGSLIVVAAKNKATRVIYYTWNEGLSWKSLQISDKPIEISNIVIEPNNISVNFLALGTTRVIGENGVITSKKGVAIALDFTSMHERVCEGNFAAFQDPTGTDYEYFTPNGKTSPECLLGAKTTYIRRKRAAQCFNPQHFEYIANYEACKCTEDDWECDYGYERDLNNRCVSVKEEEERKNMTIPEDCKNYYFKTRWYRLISGDMCVGGVDHSPIKRECPSRVPMRSAIFLLIPVVFGLVLWLVFRKSIQGWIEARPRKREKRAMKLKEYQDIKKGAHAHAHGDDDEDDDVHHRINI